MLQIKQIVNELSKLRSYNYYRELGAKELKKNRKQVTFLNLCKLYLETNPTEMFISSEVDRLSNRVALLDIEIQKIREQYKGLVQKALTARIDTFKKEYEYKKLKTQLRTLKFLLKDKIH